MYEEATRFEDDLGEVVGIYYYAIAECRVSLVMNTTQHLNNASPSAKRWPIPDTLSTLITTDGALLVGPGLARRTIMRRGSITSSCKSEMEAVDIRSRNWKCISRMCLMIMVTELWT